MKHFYLKKNQRLFLQTLIVFFIGFALNTQAQCDWQNLGNDETDQPSYGPAKYTSIASYNNETFVAYSDQDLGGKVTVSKHNGTRWNILGTRGFSGGNAEFVKMKIDKLGTPYVVFKDGANSGKASVMKYNGTSWVYVGNPSISLGIANYTSLGINDSGQVLISYADSSLGNKGVVKKFDGIAWINVGVSGFTPSSSIGNIMALDTNGLPYILFYDGSLNNTASVMRYNGTTWAYNGNSGFAGTGLSNLLISSDLAININRLNQVYASGQGFIQKLNGNTWQDLAAISPWYLGTPRQYSSIAFDNNNTPYFFFQNNTFENTLLSYNGTQLVYGFILGSAPAYERYEFQDICLVNNKLEYVYNDMRYNYKVISTLKGSGINGISHISNNSNTSRIKLAISTDGTVYAVVVSGVRDLLELLKLNNNKWEAISAMNFCSPTGIYCVGQYSVGISTAIPSMPLALVQSYGPQLTSFSPNSNTGSIISNFGLQNVMLTASLSEDGNYFLFPDNSMNGKASATLSTGNNFPFPNYIGTAGFSTGALVFGQIAYPYVVYKDNSLANQLIVKKYVPGTPPFPQNPPGTWVNVANSPISTGTITYLSFKLNNAGLPMIAMVDNGVLKIMNYNGTTWTTVTLPSGFNVDSSKPISMTLYKNEPYFTFYDSTDSKKISVIKYDGSSWIQAGILSLISTPINVTIAASPNVPPIIAYSINQTAYAKQLGSPAILNTSVSNVNPCAGSTLQFSSSGASNYNWIGPNGFSSTASSPSITNMTATKSGIYQVTFTDTGCNSFINTKSFNVKVRSKYIGSQSISLCKGKNYKIGKHTYTSSGIYKDTLSSPYGCDSIVTTNLTISNLYPVITKNINLCFGETYTFQNKIYASTGIYSDTIFRGPIDCDTLVSINLNIANQINVATSVSGNTITASQSGATYKWLNCITNILVPNKIQQSFTPISNGSYAVIVRVGVCKDTSACVVINSIGLNQVSNNSTFYISPNPNNGTFKIELASNAEVIITDVFGRELLKKNLNGGISNISLDNESSGNYFVKVITANQQFVKRIVVNKN
jgi:hypothetical protein